jgi:hypothetical protein
MMISVKSLLSSIVLLLWSFPALVRSEAYPLNEQDFVVELSDSTFEHETQASTGQTTGSWLVWFHKRNDDTPIVGDPPGEDFWAEHHTVIGSVDVSRHGHSQGRFKIRKMPALIFIHKGKFYRYPKEKNYPFSWDTIARFVAEDYENAEAEDIPPPRGFLDDVTEFVGTMWVEGAHFIKMVAAIFGVLILAAVVNQRAEAKKMKEEKYD